MESYALRFPKSKMDFRIIMSRAKQKHKKKKFFSQNTPPDLMFLYSKKNTKSIVCSSSERSAGKASDPHQYSEPQTGGEAVVSTKKGGCKKSLCKMTKNYSLFLSYNWFDLNLLFKVRTSLLCVLMYVNDEINNRLINVNK